MVEPAATRQLHMGARGQMGVTEERGVDGLVVVIYLHSHL